MNICTLIHVSHQPFCLQGDLRLYNRLFEVRSLARSIAVANALHILVFGQQRIAASCQQHRSHQERDDCLDCHDGTMEIVAELMKVVSIAQRITHRRLYRCTRMSGVHRW